MLRSPFPSHTLPSSLPSSPSSSSHSRYSLSRSPFLFISQCFHRVSPHLRFTVRNFIILIVITIGIIHFVSLTVYQKYHGEDKYARISRSLSLSPARESLHQQLLSSSYSPHHSVAFAIPVGGKTERSDKLRQIILNLLSNGVPKDNIFVFEDFLSRIGGKNSPKVGSVCRELGVQIIDNEIIRNEVENSNTFGRYLARGYKQMLDFILVGNTKNNDIYREKYNTKYVENTIPNHHNSPLPPSPSLLPPYEFAVIIEDDLSPSPDFVKYFYTLSRVMNIDPSIYCVSAHQDNAYRGSASDPKGKVMVSSSFDIRRGNHFMAPGWMTSKRIYHGIIKDNWLDDKGIYKYSEKFHLRNGHWDRFFDSQIGSLDCIFPEVPRITHDGADGFTVDKKGQMELYGNLMLSNLSNSVDYGDLTRLTKVGYEEETIQFILSSRVLSVLEESLDSRFSPLVFVVQSTDDKDDEWNKKINNYFGLIGVGGYGGWEGYVKVRGIYNGAVFVRWMTNLILLVGEYSPYIREVKKTSPVDDGITMEYLGCFKDSFEKRDLSTHVKHYNSLNISPRRCLNSCIHMGFQYSGLQNGEECWCGSSHGKYGEAEDKGLCKMKCDGVSPSLLSSSLGGKWFGSEEKDHTECGGPLLNSIYSNQREMEKEKEKTKNEIPNDNSPRILSSDSYRNPPADSLFVPSNPFESCDSACQRVSDNRMKCSESLFPLLSHSCPSLTTLLECDECKEEENIEIGIFTPAVHINQNGGRRTCLLSKGRYFNCKAKPERGYVRGCVCSKSN